MAKIKEERGSTVVEFVLILPIFLILLFSLIDFGRYFYTRVLVANASLEVASAVTRGDVTSNLQTVLNQAAPNLASFSSLERESQLTYQVTGTCNGVANQSITVKVSTAFKPIAPTAYLILSGVTPIESTSTMRCLR